MSPEGAEAALQLPLHALEGGAEAALYLIGDGTLMARKGGNGTAAVMLRDAISKGAQVHANAKDLRARAIAAEMLEGGVKELDDLEGSFIEDAMERADRVVTW